MPLREVFLPHAGTTVKLGRTPEPPGYPKLRLGRYLTTALPAPPPSTNYWNPADNSALSNLYLNDRLGDCVIAGGHHQLAIWSGNGGALFTATDAQIEADYRAIGGYIPGRPGTDRGCNESEALAYWTRTGYANGARLLGWTAIDATSPTMVKQAIWLFETAMFGVAMPNDWVGRDMPQADGFVWDVAGRANPSNGHCFTADTRVSLLDGREMSFADLAAGHAGESFWVYSCDKDGNVVPGRAHSPRKTRDQAPIVKVTLDNGEVIRCTGDHEFLMRDGVYRQAAHLTAGDSLMPLYRKPNHHGYELFYNPRTKGWLPTHRIAAFGVGGQRRNGLIAHHQDFNKSNNSPDNLVPMTPEAHSRLHQETAAILAGYARSEGGRAKSRELMEEKWADPVWRQAQIDRLASTASERGRKTASMGKTNFHTMSREQRLPNIAKAQAAVTPEVRERARLARKARIDSDPEFRAALVEQAKAASHAAARLPVTERQREARRENARRLQEKRRAALVGANNHKVVSVEADGREDVYDLTVEEHHNFALTAGVFVHNCFVATGYDARGVQVDTWGLKGTVTWAAVARYAVTGAGGELYASFSDAMLIKANNRTPNGLDLRSLVDDLDAMGADIPAPAAPTDPAPPAPG